MQAEQWIEALGLIRHPEGGYYRETYRSAEVVRREHLPPRFGGGRHFSTAIYFLLDRSADRLAFGVIAPVEVCGEDSSRHPIPYTSSSARPISGVPPGDAATRAARRLAKAAASATDLPSST